MKDHKVGFSTKWSPCLLLFTYKRSFYGWLQRHFQHDLKVLDGMDTWNVWYIDIQSLDPRACSQFLSKCLVYCWLNKTRMICIEGYLYMLLMPNAFMNCTGFFNQSSEKRTSFASRTAISFFGHPTNCSSKHGLYTLWVTHCNLLSILTKQCQTVVIILGHLSTYTRYLTIKDIRVEYRNVCLNTGSYVY